MQFPLPCLCMITPFILHDWFGDIDGTHWPRRPADSEAFRATSPLPASEDVAGRLAIEVEGRHRSASEGIGGAGFAVRGAGGGQDGVDLAVRDFKRIPTHVGDSGLLPVSRSGCPPIPSRLLTETAGGLGEHPSGPPAALVLFHPRDPACSNDRRCGSVGLKGRPDGPRRCSGRACSAGAGRPCRGTGGRSRCSSAGLRGRRGCSPRPPMNSRNDASLTWRAAGMISRSICSTAARVTSYSWSARSTSAATCFSSAARPDWVWATLSLARAMFPWLRL